MGVTLGRKVLKGGRVAGQTEEFNLGKPLTDRVDTFVGIAGGNWGLTNCYPAVELVATCSDTNGFFPGYTDSSTLSAYLLDLNQDTTREAQHTFAMLSTMDDLISYGDVVYGRFTSEYPTEDYYRQYNQEKYGHIAMRDLTADAQFELVTSHTTKNLKPNDNNTLWNLVE